MFFHLYFLNMYENNFGIEKRGGVIQHILLISRIILQSFI